MRHAPANAYTTKPERLRSEVRDNQDRRDSTLPVFSIFRIEIDSLHLLIILIFVSEPRLKARR